jgi:hypothetical protein
MKQSCYHRKSCKIELLCNHSRTQWHYWGVDHKSPYSHADVIVIGFDVRYILQRYKKRADPWSTLENRPLGIFKKSLAWLQIKSSSSLNSPLNRESVNQLIVLTSMSRIKKLLITWMFTVRHSLCALAHTKTRTCLFDLTCVRSLCALTWLSLTWEIQPGDFTRPAILVWITGCD